MNPFPREVTVSLVAKPEQARRDFPDLMENRSLDSLVSVPCRIAIGPDGLDPAKNKFAAWLAVHISTTDRNDDASRLRLLMPYTAGEELLERRLKQARRIAHSSGLAGALDALEAAIERERKTLVVMNPRSVDRLVVTDFTWPVYGEHALGRVQTPAQFFEYCAARIRRMGAVPLSAGIEQARPDDSLLATFARGRGLDLIRRHERECAGVAA